MDGDEQQQSYRKIKKHRGFKMVEVSAGQRSRDEHMLVDRRRKILKGVSTDSFVCYGGKLEAYSAVANEVVEWARLSG